ncbi:MAG: HAMP domain-containing protein, partial [Actinomycetota bacterium]|nr:HAMP domain-containing protein [Actinomycetota bacterium]
MATGVGTLGAQYAGVLAAGRRALLNFPRSDQLQKAIVLGQEAKVAQLAEQQSPLGLRITVEQGGKLLTPPAPPGSRGIGPPQQIATTPVSTVHAYADAGALIGGVEQADEDFMLGLATGTKLQLSEERTTLPPAALALGHPFGIDVQHTRYRAAARKVSDSEAVALYPQHRLDSYARTIRLKVALLMGLLLLLIGAGAILAVRSLTHTLRAFADGIRAVASGRFDQRLPVRGGDEFSQFGAVFNQMSSQLEQRIEELDSERRRVQEFGQRFGAALAATHDVASL